MQPLIDNYQQKKSNHNQSPTEIFKPAATVTTTQLVTPSIVVYGEEKTEKMAFSRAVATVSGEKLLTQQGYKDNRSMEDELKNVDDNEDKDISNPASSANNSEDGYIAKVKPRQRKYSSTYVPPSSDHNVEIKYYGNQRVVIKKP